MRPAPGLVRCLGNDPREHTFFSTDRTRVRLCPRCRKRADARHISPVFHAAVPAPRGESYRSSDAR